MQKYKKSQNHPLKLMNLKNKTTKQEINEFGFAKSELEKINPTLF